MPATPLTSRYAAFVSYRHHPVDRRWAMWAHRSLERYRVPRRLQKEHGLSARIGLLFRDEDETVAGERLDARLRAALSESAYLVVVCSPRAAKSPAISAEIQYFASTVARPERILPLLIEGDYNDALPAALKQSVSCPQTKADGERIDIDAVPIAADVRPRAGTSNRELRRQAKISLAAALLGCSFDELRQREQERRQRRRLIASAAALVLVLVLGGLSTSVWVSVRRAQSGASASVTRRAQARAQAGDPVGALHLTTLAISLAPHSADGQWANRRRLGVLNRESPRFLGTLPGSIWSRAAFSRSGDQVVIADEAGAIQLREVSSGRVLDHLTGRRGRPLEVELDDGSRTVAIVYDATDLDQPKLDLWVSRFGQNARPWSFAVRGVAAGHTGARLISGDGRLVLLRIGPEVIVFHAESGRVLRTLGSVARGELCGCVDSAGRLAAVTKGRFTSIVEVATGAVTANVETGEGNLIACAIGSEGRHFYASRWAPGDRWTSTLWPLYGSGPPTALDIRGVNQAAFSGDGSFLLTRSPETGITIVPIGTPPRLWVRPELATLPEGLVEFTPDSQKVAVLDRDSNLMVLDVHTGLPLWRFNRDREVLLDAVWSASGTAAAVVNSQGVNVWALPQKVQTSSTRSFEGSTRVVAWAEDTNLFLDLTSVGDSAMHGRGLVDGNTGRVIPVFPAGVNCCNGPVTLSPDGTKIAAMATPGEMWLWSVANPAARVTIRPAARAGATFSSDGRSLAVFGAHSFQVFSTVDGAVRPPHLTFKPNEVVFAVRDRSTAGGFLLLTGDGRLTTWPDLERRAHSLAMQNALTLQDMSVHEGTSRFASAIVNDVALYDLSTGRQVAQLAGHRKPVWKLRFSSSGRLLASGDESGAVIVWDTTTGQALARFGGQLGPIVGLRFTDDDLALIAAAADLTAARRDLSPIDLPASELGRWAETMTGARLEPSGLVIAR